MNKRYSVVVVLKLLLIALALTGLFGCAPSTVQQGVRLDSLRVPDPELKTVNLEIKKSALKAAQSNLDGVARIRIVQIYYRNQEYGGFLPPEYRLFDILNGSVYQLLGLKDGDVLVAANGYIIQQPELFRTYARLLGTEPTADVQIRREGSPLLLKYSFVD